MPIWNGCQLSRGGVRAPFRCCALATPSTARTGQPGLVSLLLSNGGMHDVALLPVEARTLDRSLLRGVAWTAGAKWASQALTWASWGIVARLLTPEDHGLVG